MHILRCKWYIYALSARSLIIIIIIMILLLLLLYTIYDTSILKTQMKLEISVSFTITKLKERILHFFSKCFLNAIGFKCKEKDKKISNDYGYGIGFFSAFYRTECQSRRLF